jgi:hypothetical protein
MMRYKTYKHRGLDETAKNQTEAFNKIEARIDKIIVNMRGPEVYSGKGWVLVIFCDGEGFGYSIHDCKPDEPFKFRPSCALGHKDFEDARLHAFRHLASILEDIDIIPTYDEHGRKEFLQTQTWHKNYKAWRELGKDEDTARNLAYKSPDGQYVYASEVTNG